MSGGGRNIVQIELEPELPLVNADGRRISQVLVNLLSNADRHSPEDSLLRITASQDEAYVSFCVEDKGRGISAQRLPHIVREIARRHGEEGSGKNQGSGWGLSICKGIVEAHGGRMWVESDGVGHGTRVTFTVPIAENAGGIAHAFSESDAADERPRRHGRTPILVVDDDPQTLRNVREAITKVGFVVVALRKATVIVQQVQKSPFVMDELTIDYARRRVTIGERDVRLSVIEYRLLVELSEHAGGILTHEHLQQTVWRRSSPRDTRPLRAAIKNLRRKLGDDADNPTYIFNQSRVGYRLGAEM